MLTLMSCSCSALPETRPRTTQTKKDNPSHLPQRFPKPRCLALRGAMVRSEALDPWIGDGWEYLRIRWRHTVLRRCGARRFGPNAASARTQSSGRLTGRQKRAPPCPSYTGPTTRRKGYGLVSVEIGKPAKNVAPSPSTESDPMAPPTRSTISLEIAKPGRCLQLRVCRRSQPARTSRRFRLERLPELRSRTHER